MFTIFAILAVVAAVVGTVYAGMVIADTIIETSKK